MKICAIGDPHGNLEKIKKIPLKDVDLILLTGDLGKADLARQRSFENTKRKQKGLPELEKDSEYAKKSWNEIHYSAIEILKYLLKFSPVYTIFGNVGTNMIKSSVRKKEEEKYNIKLPNFGEDIKNLNNLYIIKNRLRNSNGIRIGFLEYFLDISWVKEFKPSEYEKRLKKAKKETEKAKKILKRFGSGLDILICHQPPYRILDKVNFPGIPENWRGKHAGSKIILNYIKKYQPRYVFCGHVHEGKGKIKIGKTQVYNLGVAGYKVIELNNKNP